MDLASAAGAFSSLELHLNPQVWGSEEQRGAIAEGLRGRRLVIVRNALLPTFAEQVHECLEAATNWRVMDSDDAPELRQGPSALTFRHRNIYMPGDDQAALHFCLQVFCSRATADFIARLAGVPCGGETAFRAAYYQPGDHSCPHTDELADPQGIRRVAFVWYLTRGWSDEWGGALYWCPTRRYLSPEFNTLALFQVFPDMDHGVMPVSPLATAKRLSVHGWFRDTPTATPQSATDAAPAAGTVLEIGRPS